MLIVQRGQRTRPESLEAREYRKTKNVERSHVKIVVALSLVAFSEACRSLWLVQISPFALTTKLLTSLLPRLPLQPLSSGR
jgi:hypothetical protein